MKRVSVVRLDAIALQQIDVRMAELESLFLVPMETEDETLALLLEYIQLDGERDRLLEALCSETER